MDSILIVNDVAVNRRILIEILNDAYVLHEACDGEQALAFAHSHAHELSLILMDIMIPKLDGHEVLRQLKSDRTTQHIPVMLISALDSEMDESRGLSEGAIDYITKPFNPQIVKCRVRNHVELKRYQDLLLELADQRAQKIMDMRESIFDAVTSIIEYRNLESGHHVKRLRLFCEAQLQHLLKCGMFPQELDRRSAEIIARASSLHDIGKVGLPDSILVKPSCLTPEEYELMKTHPIIGCNFLDSLSRMEDEDYIFYARQICRHHHERWDGTGYPDGLRGEEIPLSARVVAIADVYDALMSRRVYKPAYTHEETVAIMQKGAGTQFDPRLIEAFLQVADQFRQIALTHCD